MTHERVSAPTAPQSVAAFVRLAKEKKRLNTHVFSLVERYMGRDKNQVVYYPPPGGDTFESAV